MGKDKRRVLVIGGQFAGNFVARDLKKHFHITVVDAKEYFEYTPGILRAFVKPAHFDALSFTLQPVYERSIGVKLIWGEVKELSAENNTATVKPIFANTTDVISFDYCVICAGCNFGPFQKNGESLWFPVIHEWGRSLSAWSHIDERFIEGRRRHILEEYHAIEDLNKNSSEILVVGAGFIGVEWATELEHFFPDLKITIIDFLPLPLGPLPQTAAEYCQEYMHASDIKQFYNKKYNASDQKFWDDIEMPNKPAKEYVCIGVKASNYFMPAETLSEKGPGGGGWIHFNMKLQVTKKPTDPIKEGETWGKGNIFAVGDCNFGCIGTPEKWILPVIPKISYPGEEQAFHACMNIEILDRAIHRTCGDMVCCRRKGMGRLKDTWWPWGAGMFATSLGPHDACFVMAANENKGSGYMVNWWIPAALQKEIIETTKIDECKNRPIGKLIWHFVHHTPFQLWGKGPCCPMDCCQHECCCCCDTQCCCSCPC